MRYTPLLILLLLVACGTSTIRCWDGSIDDGECPPEQSGEFDATLKNLLNRHTTITSYEFKESSILTLEPLGPFAGTPQRHVKVYGDNVKMITYGEFGDEQETVYLDLGQQTCSGCQGSYDDYVPILPTDFISSVPTTAIIEGTPYPYKGIIGLRDQDRDIVNASALDVPRSTSVVQWDESDLRYWLEVDEFSGLPRRVMVFSDGMFIRGVEYVYFGYETVDEEDVVE